MSGSLLAIISDSVREEGPNKVPGIGGPNKRNFLKCSHGKRLCIAKGKPVQADYTSYILALTCPKKDLLGCFHFFTQFINASGNSLLACQRRRSTVVGRHAR